MCGIAAALSSPTAVPQVERMKLLLRHRGDQSDPVISIGDSFALGTERLRIVDAANGAQPFTSFDGAWQVIFNGEIYNYQELRSMLKGQGVPFHTDSDTEVLTNLIAVEGERGLDLLDGMFAFVAIRTDQQDFLAARDPMGVKPLYFIRHNSELLFSSEIRPLTETAPQSMVEYVSPGTWFSRSSRGRFWDRYSFHGKSDVSLEQHTAELKNLLEEAVRKRLPSDLPSAVFFSGGIDSTLIYHIARKFRPDVRGYFIGNPDGRDYAYAKAYAESCGGDIVFVPSPLASVLEAIAATVEAVETFEPNQVRSGTLTYLLSEAIARDGYKVALCGEGADELFCGYPELQATGPEQTPGETEAIIWSRRNHWLDYLHRTQLQRVDRCSMRHALEVRVPFLDKKIIAFAEKLPLSQLVTPNSSAVDSNKIVLRKVYDFYPEIPSNFSRRNKVVFSAGSGMGNNDPVSGPFYTKAKEECAGGLEVKPPAELNLKTVEETYYWSLLNRVIDTSRVPFLADRPRVNTR